MDMDKHVVAWAQARSIQEYWKCVDVKKMSVSGKALSQTKTKGNFPTWRWFVLFC